MPALTPSRLALVVFFMFLSTFIWTFGLPRSVPAPSFPNVNHEPHKAPGITLAPKPFLSTGVGAAGHRLNSHAATPVLVRPSQTSRMTNHEQLTKSTSATSSAKVQMPQQSLAACQNVKGASDVMVIVKTSAAEIYSKLPRHLLTLLSCAPHYAIFSDHNGTIAGHAVHNALADIAKDTMDQHDEFLYYHMIQAHGQENQILGDFKGQGSKNLDKWKFLPMVYKAYKLDPSKKFFMFMEADTSLSWTNLLQWTTRLDFRIPYYIGAPTFVGATRFAQRGSGFLISNAAMKYFAKKYEEKYHSVWEKATASECCGDLVLAMALNEAHVDFRSAFPLLQGESPSTLDWTERHWCAPVVSWHNMNANEIDILWGFQKEWTKTRGWGEPYLIRNTFKSFVSPLLADNHTSWDNLSQDTKISKPANEISVTANKDWYKLSEGERDSVRSRDQCRGLCEGKTECLQWKWKASQCHLGNVIRLGRRIVPKENDTEETVWTSGWMLDRIDKATKGWGECDEANWKFNQ